jgi:hypothetical protein
MTTTPSTITKTINRESGERVPLEFNASNLLTVGVELELQLIDRRT